MVAMSNLSNWFYLAGSLCFVIGTAINLWQAYS